MTDILNVKYNGSWHSIPAIKGDKGDDGYSLCYVHDQAEASDIWVINHNLNKHPSVSLVDTAGTQFIGSVEYIDDNTCKVYINGATKGKAYLN